MTDLFDPKHIQVLDKKFTIFASSHKIGCYEWWDTIQKATWYYADELLKVKWKHNTLVGQMMKLGLCCAPHWKYTPLFQTYCTFVKDQKHMTIAGMILLSNQDAKTKAPSHMLMIRPTGCSNRWTFPKGKTEKKESLWQTAKREAEEEIGYKSKEETNSYRYIELVDHSRLVRFYIIPHVDAGTTVFQSNAKYEVEEIAWKSITGDFSLCSLAQKVCKRLLVHLETYKNEYEKVHLETFKNEKEIETPIVIPQEKEFQIQDQKQEPQTPEPCLQDQKQESQTPDTKQKQQTETNNCPFNHLSTDLCAQCVQEFFDQHWKIIGELLDPDGG